MVELRQSVLAAGSLFYPNALWFLRCRVSAPGDPDGLRQGARRWNSITERHSCSSSRPPS